MMSEFLYEVIIKCIFSLYSKKGYDLYMEVGLNLMGVVPVWARPRPSPLDKIRGT